MRIEHKHIGPTLYEGARWWRVDQAILNGLREHVERECGAGGIRAFRSVEECIYEAYAAGVTDGFAQGVAAESGRRDAAVAEFEWKQKTS